MFQSVRSRIARLAQFARYARFSRVGRTSPFFGVRGKLVVWNISVLGAILLLVGVGVYFSQSVALETQVNNQLASQAQHELDSGLPLAALREPATGSGSTSGSGAGMSADPDADAYRADESPNLFSLVVDLKGQVVSGAVGVQALGLPDAIATRPVLAGTATSTLVTLDAPHSAGGGHFRLYTVPVILNGHIIGALQVGTSLTPRYAELRQFLLLLAVCGGVGLLLAAAGGFLLAHRALVPVRLAFERQRTFVADASHELRTPLSLIRAEAELLQRTFQRQPQPESQAAATPASKLVRTHGAGSAGGVAGVGSVADGRDIASAARELPAGTLLAADDDTLTASEMAGDLLAEIDYMNRLITALLQLARIDRGSEVLERVPVDLTALAARTCQFAQPLAAERGLALTYRAGPEIDEAPVAEADRRAEGSAEDSEGDGAGDGDGRCWVLGDADRLRQLVLILLDNALRYTSAPGSVRVACWDEVDVVVLRVSDSGPGIAPEHLPHLFDRFYRVDKARSRELGGSGLGLAIGAWIAQAHDGALTVTSAPGSGATFQLTLPAADGGVTR